MLENLQQFLTEFKSQLKELADASAVLNLKAKYLGKRGLVSEVLKTLKDVDPRERKEIGPKVNQIKDEMQQLVREKLFAIEAEEINRKLVQERIDITLLDRVRADGVKSGGHHPRHILQRKIEDIFLSMGFEILDGPHIEDEFHNFEALNIPADHPARDMQDTFWFTDKLHLLRTHTSTIQVRGMQARKAPFRFIAPGTVFRSERTDVSHEMVFNQLEGMLVDEDISVGHLIYFAQTLIKEIFNKEIKTRLRPGYFPFVEPGLELDINCFICGGKGCPVCKNSGWLELLPCGMVHPTVLKHGGVDAEKYSGFAFGLGLDRLVMMKYAIDDIRHLNSGDLRFNHQFKAF